ncbi:MAG TPA: polyhydroxyalkanoic acid system family protein [Thermoanaerobaculia bacterium]|nr:polyhydroxyalkanoic acid system family protein [Thermoanaerobaculia bacterium]
MRISIPHHTTRADAHRRVDARLSQLLSQFGDRADDLSHEWVGDTLKFRGKARGLNVEGTLEVTDSEIILDSKLPLIAKPFESRIRQAVEQEAGTMFRA